MTSFLKEKYKVLLNIFFFIIFLSISNIFLPNLPPGSGLSLFINNIIWLAGIFFVCIAILYIVNKGYWTKPENFIIHLSLIFVLVIPFIWSDDNTGRGFYRMLAAVFGIIFFLCLYTSFSKKKIWSLVLIISLSGLIQAFLGVAQIWIIPELIIPHGAPLGVFQQSNVMASYIVTTFLVSLLLISVYPVPYRELDKWVRHGINLFAFLLGVLIVPLNSSTAYLALIISLPLMLLAHIGNSRQIWIIISLIFVGSYIDILSNYIELVINYLATLLNLGGNVALGISTELGNISLKDTLDPTGRKEIWLICWEIFKSNWLTGVGYGNFEQSFLEYQALYYQQHGVYAFEKLYHPHNELILWFIEGGVLPGTAFAIYILYTLFRMFKMGKSALPYAAILIPLVIHALLEYPFYHSAIHWFLFITLLYFFELQVGDTINVQIKYKSLINSVVVSISLLGAFFFITNMHGIAILTEYNETDFRKRNVETLSKIRNNFTVQPHLDYFTVYGSLRKGMANKDEILIKRSIHLSEKLHDNHPRPEYYKSMLTAYKLLGDKKNFRLKLGEARYYYPLNKDFIELEEKYKGIL